MLRWPKFHPELLTQSYWNAGENLGRIKVTITEGYLQGDGLLPFTKTKNVVTFSFQHAPQREFIPVECNTKLTRLTSDILESSGIAWPNTGMWYQPTQPIYNSASPAKRDPFTEELDMHAHSPRRRTSSTNGLRDKFSTAMPIEPMHTSMLPPPPPPFSRETPVVSWTPVSSLHDPFVENGRKGLWNRRSVGRSSESDQPMPDYTRSVTPATSSHQSNNNDYIAHSRPSTGLENRQALEESLTNMFNEITEGSSGVSAPANTRASSAANTPPFPNRPSFAAEARAASYTRTRAVSITPNDGPPKSRESSDTTMKSHSSEEYTKEEQDAGKKIHAIPATEIKGRKEGKAEPTHLQPLQCRPSRDITVVASGGSDKENSAVAMGATTTVVLSEGKRKRPGTGTGSVSSRPPSRAGAAEEGPEVVEVSPSVRKVSKRTGGPGSDEEGARGAGERKVLRSIINQG